MISQDVENVPAEQEYWPCPDWVGSSPLVILLADGTTIRFQYVGRGFWSAWRYLRGRCTRVMLLGKEIPASEVNPYNSNLPR